MTSCRIRKIASASTTPRFGWLFGGGLRTWPRFMISTRFLERCIGAGPDNCGDRRHRSIHHRGLDHFRSTLGLSGYAFWLLHDVHPAPPTGTNNCGDPAPMEMMPKRSWMPSGPGRSAERSHRSGFVHGHNKFRGFIALQNLLNESGTPPAIVSISYGDSEPDLGASIERLHSAPCISKR